MKLKNDVLIKKWEELRLVAYLPTPDDVWTIGWGHTKTAKKGMSISQEEAQALFEQDVAWAEAAVNKLVKVKLNQDQFDTLVSLVFNIGEPAFKKSTLLAKLNAGDYKGAAAQFPRWVYQNKKVLRGLVKRRAEEMAIFLGADNGHVGHATVDQEPGLKPLPSSKEIAAGIGAVVTGAAGLVPQIQDQVPGVIAGIVICLGIFLVYNRVRARYRGER